MNQNIWLKAAGRKLSVEDLRSGKFVKEFQGQEKDAVQFCFHWLNEKPSFDFQTSGSTGAPRKITFRREQLIFSAQLTKEALQLQSGYNLLVCLDVNFIAGALMLVRGMVRGMNMIVVPPSSDPLQNMEDTIDFAAFVPLQVNTLIQKHPVKINAIKKIIIGGAVLDEKLGSKIKNLSNQVFATYGMTETITHIALQKLNGPNQQDCFHLLPGISCTLDNRGCLIISAPHLDAQVITNDVVEFISENKFKWIGRYDRVINSGGIKIQPEKIESEIENVLRTLGSENRFFVTGVKDEVLGEKLILVMEGSVPDKIKTEILQELSVHLPTFETPKEIWQTDHFEQTNTQKVDRMHTLEKLIR